MAKALKETNYVKHKGELIELISRGSLCCNCLARPLCKKIASDKHIDVSKDIAPCKEAWEAWCNSIE